MRSAVLLSALCAAGALGSHNHNHKRVYVTDLTVTTVTETVTIQPSPDPATNLPIPEIESVKPTPESTSSEEPAPETTSSDKPTPETTPSEQPAPQTDSPASTTTTDNLPPVPTVTPKDVQGGNGGGGGNGKGNGKNVVWKTAWTKAWTSVWTKGGGGGEPTKTTTDGPTATPTNQYQHDVLYNHNVHRGNHSSDGMSWSPTLEASAHKLAAKCVYQHDTSIDGGGYGQNIGYGVDSNKVGKMISNLMYNSEFMYFKPYFGMASPDMNTFDQWGHFTQILWKGTSEVGCATVVCDSLGNVDARSAMPFTVCNYSPPGNMKGAYAENVGEPQGQPIYAV